MANVAFYVLIKNKQWQPKSECEFHSSTNKTTLCILSKYVSVMRSPESGGHYEREITPALMPQVVTGVPASEGPHETVEMYYLSRLTFIHASVSYYCVALMIFSCPFPFFCCMFYLCCF